MLIDQFKKRFLALKTHAAQRAAKWKSLVLGLAPAALLLAPLTAHAQLEIITSLAGSLISSVGTLVVWVFVIYEIAHLFAQIVGGVFLFLINFLIGVSQYNSFLGSPIVTIGWSVTRDFANLFLVIALLIIAFATILNIQSYQAQNLMKKFLFAAIAVNFSKMICGLMIDASQVVMMTFVSGYSDTAAGNFVKLFQVKEWLQLAIKNAPTNSSIAANSTDSGEIAKFATDIFSTIGGDVFAAIVGFFGILAILSLVIILVVRIITLWFLIVAAPLAFVASVLPATASYGNKWWDAFFKQLLAGPIVAFLIWISLASVAMGGQNALDLTKDSYQSQQGTLYAETSAASTAITINKISEWGILGMYFIPIVLFIMGAKWAVSMSGGLASSATGWAQGKLRGYAGAGVGWLRRQSTTGKAGVFTQTGRAFTGRSTLFGSGVGLAGGAAAGLVGGLGGRKLEEMANRRGGFAATIAQRTRQGVNAVGKGYSNTMGPNAQAVLRKTTKKVKEEFARRTEMGKRGEEYEKIRESGQMADYIGGKANKEYDAEMQRIATLAITPERRTELEQSALGKFRSAQGQASESRKEAVEGHKKLLDMAGLKDPIALRDHLQNKISNREPIDQSELEAIQEKIKEHYDKEEGRRVSAGRADAANQGEAWTAERENEVKGKVAAERSNVTDYVSEMTRIYANEQNPNAIIGAEARANNLAGTQKTFKDQTRLPPQLESRKQGQDLAKAITEAVGTTTDLNPARTQFHGNVRREVDRSFNRDRANQNLTQDEKKKRMSSVVLEAVGQLPLGERDNYLRAGVRDTTLPTHVRDAIADAATHLARDLAPPLVEQQIKDRRALRDTKGDSNWSAADVGMQRNPQTSRYEFTGASAAALQNLIQSKVVDTVSKLKNDILSSTDGKRVIGTAVPSAAELQTIMNRLDAAHASAATKDKSDILERMKNIAKAVEEHSTDNAVRYAASMHTRDLDARTP